MADKKDAKPAPPPELPGPLGSKGLGEFFFFAVIFVALLSYLLLSVLGFFTTRTFLDLAFFRRIEEWFLIALPYLKILSFLACVLLVFAIIRVSRLFGRLKTEIDQKYAPPENVVLSAQTGAVAYVNPANKKWERIRDHMKSENPNDWKIAILDADAILEEIVDSMGYHGENLGAKLKSVEPADFSTLDNAWEAHKMRNAIAHGGADFQLNDREAQRIISLFQSVFEEFKYI